MHMGSTFGVIGGDHRQLYLARSLKRDGYPVLLSCLEQCADPEEFPQLPPGELAARCAVVILPLPVTRDGQLLNAPFADSPVSLDDSFAALFAGKTVFGGMTEKLRASSPLWQEAELTDYYHREELVLGNAFLTAEGAVGTAIREYEGALIGSRCLVTGFGRIGKALCLDLRGLGAQVDCCARKAADRTFIRSIGCRALEYRESGGEYDVIFNTVPAPVLTARQLSRQRPGTLILELASAPGGVDRDAALRLGLRVIELPSLPGKCSPKASGELIKEAIYNMLEER